MTEKQAQILGLKPSCQLSPLFEKNCLLLSGNESFQDAEKDIVALTEIKVSHSTLQRLVQRQEYELPLTRQGVSEVSIDGGKVRLRSQVKGMESYWRDYKTVRLQGIYYGAFFQDNLSLTDWVNSQRLLHPLICLGDGRFGGLESVSRDWQSSRPSGNLRLVSPNAKISTKSVGRSNVFKQQRRSSGKVRLSRRALCLLI